MKLQFSSAVRNPQSEMRPPAAGGKRATRWFAGALAGLAFAAISARAQTDVPVKDAFSFAITCDMRGFVGPAKSGKRFFDGACEVLRDVGPGAFMIVPGDCDPIPPVRATLDRYLGSNYVWYPVAGNHEAETPRDMAWLRNWASNGIPHLVRSGPAGAETTMFAFDYGNSHFVVLNNYFDGKTDAGRKSGFATNSLDWLEQDLAANRKPLVWVIGHEPLVSQPDMDTGRVRHKGGLLTSQKERATRLLELLRRYPVRAYLCGHTHNTSAVKVQGLWQLDAGHARGAGDSGAPSTFMKIRVAGARAWLDIFRADKRGTNYQLKRTVELD
jgi:predicted phosphodiesterase